MSDARVSHEILRTDLLGRRPQPSTGGPTVAATGEFALIDAVTAGLATSPEVVIGPGDDAAAVIFHGPTLVSVDVLVEGVHFRRDWSSAHQIGRKAVAQNVSDIEAMGAVAKALVVGVSVPGDLPLSWASDLLAGMAAEAGLAGVVIVGGDTTSSRDITISVTVLGGSDLPPVRRSGARPGNVVAFSGRLGWSAGGYVVLSRGFGSPRELVAAHQVPAPPYGQGRVAAAAGATALIDVSDGLLSDAGHIATASGVAIDIDPAALPVSPELDRLGAATGVDPLTLVLTGGEDHALLGCFPPGSVPEAWTVIGRVSEGSGVTVGGQEWSGPTGWDHFAR